jgi:hypothetical protein
MLWQKGWLETRLRLLFALAFIGFMLYMLQSAHYGAAKPLRMIVQNTAPSCVMAFCALLGGAGIVTQPPFQATKGTHGSILFTLSLPVTRLRLLAVRATIGWLELAALIAALCTGMWLISSPLRATVMPAEMAEYAVTLIICASALYCLSVLLATFLEDQWRIWGTMIISVAMWWLFSHIHLPASTDIFEAMSMRSPIITHTMPWSAMAFALTLAATFLFAALKIAQSREY